MSQYPRDTYTYTQKFKPALPTIAEHPAPGVCLPTSQALGAATPKWRLWVEQPGPTKHKDQLARVQKIIEGRRADPKICHENGGPGMNAGKPAVLGTRTMSHEEVVELEEMFTLEWQIKQEIKEGTYR
ncbi:hypothetical protein HYFRA_00008375 [Hymenoscyphus fraxineus]|uniref:Uncharacterized protein n=1 Tax=Hymenoscyphus fraxineus TaxID=746836 RepID=A0A9N9KLY4_9HELO|nr:hypothetical protein HYFRA_00008375 [Hymenoscyphus fraxineus]